MSSLRRFWRALATVIAAVAGMQTFTSCPVYGAVGVYGMPSVPLDIAAFSYTPPSPIHTGDTLTFIAQLEPAQNVAADVYAEVAPALFHVQLHDDGLAPDALAGDNVFSGSGQWTAECGTGPQRLHLYARGYKPGGEAQGAAELPLEVLP